MTTIREIQLAVCAEFRITREQLLSRDRHASLVRPRHIAMQRARATGASLQKIAREFHRRDHTTVINAIRKAGHDPA